MGQKVNPISFRVGINQAWDSRWTHDRNYTKYFEQDLAIRNFIEDLCRYQELFAGNITIWRTCSLRVAPFRIINQQYDKTSVYIYFQVFLPLKKHALWTNWAQKQEWLYVFENTIQTHLEDKYGLTYNIGLLIDPIFEENTNENKRIKSKVENDTNANNDLVKWLLNKNCLMIAEWIATEFQKRKGLKELCKTIEKCYDHIQNEDKNIRYKLRGIKVTCSGRFKLTDNEKRRNKMARIKSFKKGQIPLQTLNKHINYHATTAYTPDGTSGIKVWISYEPVYLN